jgi:hypothetical protein
VTGDTAGVVVRLATQLTSGLVVLYKLYVLKSDTFSILAQAFAPKSAFPCTIIVPVAPAK